MAHIIDTNHYSRAQYEAEWEAILVECEQRANYASNFTSHLLFQSVYDDPSYYEEATRIFYRRFGVSVSEAVFGRKDFYVTI